MTGARVLLLLIRFVSELGALLAFTLWGFSESGWFGVIPPLVGAAVWRRWMAPTSDTRLADPRRLLAEIVFFATAASAFAAAGAPAVGGAYGVVAIACALAVRYVGEPEVREPSATPAA
jgi:Protein of unknown function (DUF2568)